MLNELREEIRTMTKERHGEVLDLSNGLEYRKQWEEISDILYYMHRWVVGKQQLPAALRAKLVRRIREWPDEADRRLFEIVAHAMEENDPSLVMGMEETV